ncbi:MAG: DUF4331 family protein [Polyangiaceae bacterium]
MNARSFLMVSLTTLALAAFAGCGDGGSGSGGTGGATATGGTTATGGSTGGSGGTTTTTMMPKPPTLGAQIDRMGRPAINTALDHTFDTDATAKDTAKDAWNANSDASTWATYVPEVEKNLAILDSLDTVCGNQLLADKNKNDASRYAGLAGVLADDRLFVNTAGSACTQYLAVEGNAIGLANNDCGGRRLSYDVIETSYSALAAGMLTGIDDKIAISDAAKGETFPYLAAPQ